MHWKKWKAKYCNACGRFVGTFYKHNAFPRLKYWCVNCVNDRIRYEQSGKRSRFKESNYCILCGSLLPGRQYRFCNECMPYNRIKYLDDQFDWIDSLKLKVLEAQKHGDFKNKHFCNACGAINDRFKVIDNEKIEKSDDIIRDRKVAFNTLCSACHRRVMIKWDAWITEKEGEKDNLKRHSVNVEMVNFRNYGVNHYCIKCGGKLVAEEKKVKEESWSDDSKVGRICSTCSLYDFIPGWDPIDKYLTLYGDKTKVHQNQALLLYADSRQLTTLYKCPHTSSRRYNYNCDIDFPYKVIHVCRSCNLRLRHKIRRELRALDKLE